MIEKSGPCCLARVTDKWDGMIERGYKECVLGEVNLGVHAPKVVNTQYTVRDCSGHDIEGELDNLIREADRKRA